MQKRGIKKRVKKGKKIKKVKRKKKRIKKIKCNIKKNVEKK